MESIQNYLATVIRQFTSIDKSCISLLVNYMTFNHLLIEQRCKLNCLRNHLERIETCPLFKLDECDCYTSNKTAIIIYVVHDVHANGEYKLYGQRICNPLNNMIKDMKKSGISIAPYLNNDLFCPFVKRVSCIICRDFPGRNNLQCTRCKFGKLVKQCHHCKSQGVLKSFWETRSCHFCQGVGSFPKQYETCTFCIGGYLRCTSCQGTAYDKDKSIKISDGRCSCFC